MRYSPHGFTKDGFLADSGAAENIGWWKMVGLGRFELPT
jgi:hypothetical protein